MAYKNFNGVVPLQYTGSVIDTEQKLELETEAAAKQFYQLAKQRLLLVNQWHDVAGLLSAKFQLVDAGGEAVDRPVQQGDYFKISIPGPRPSAGDGYDWVRVEAVENQRSEHEEFTAIRVRPTSPPGNNNEEVAHFYAPESTSNFIVARRNKVVMAAVYDRNTKANTDAENLMDKLRDPLVGMGALAIFSKLQWSALVQGILKKEN